MIKSKYMKAKFMVSLAVFALIGAIFAPSFVSLPKDVTAVKAATTSKVDSRFHEATTSNPWTYTDYQGDYYSGCDITVTGASLLSNLSSLTNSNYSSGSYEKLKTTLPLVCKFANGQAGMVGFYNRAVLPTAWDGAATWNREHVWPNSRGAGESGPGSNPFVIMPTSVSINSSRGNNFFGLSGSKTWDPGQYDTQFRGAAARCILFAAMQYKDKLSLSENPNDSSSQNTMGVKSLLLEWNMQYKPDADEMYRNNLTAKQYGARNPFIDYPYLADKIWGDGQSDSSSSSSSSSSDVTPTLSNQYFKIDNVSEIVPGSKVLIAGLGSDNKSIYALQNEIYSAKTPWYLQATQITSSGAASDTIETSLTPSLWEIKKNGDCYTFENEEAGYLKSYVSGTYYSVGLTKKPGSASSLEGSNDWNISFDSGGAAILKSSENVYLSFVNSSSYTEFRGSSSSQKIYLYKADTTDANEEASLFASSFLNEVRGNCTLEQQGSLLPSEALLASWKKMGEAASLLSSSAKAILKNDNSTDSDILACQELYDFICLKYHEALNVSGGDFLGRFGSNPNLKRQSGNLLISDSSTLIAVGLAFIALVSLGVLIPVLSKKRKS